MRENKAYPVSGSLHITESSDGALTAWLDRTSIVNPRSPSKQAELRNGERLEIVTDQNKLTLTTTGLHSPTPRYEGTLSSEGEHLVGEWPAPWRLAAPDNFVRIH